MTGDLVAFLRARLDEDAATAMGARDTEFCKDGRWNVRGPFGDDEGLGSVQSYVSEAILGEDEDNVPFPLAAHIARHDPARVLAEVDAKRRIVDEADLYLCDSGPGCGYRTKHGHSVLRLLALPYADHPDYREEWRP